MLQRRDHIIPHAPLITVYGCKTQTSLFRSQLTDANSVIIILAACNRCLQPAAWLPPNFTKTRALNKNTKICKKPALICPDIITLSQAYASAHPHIIYANIVYMCSHDSKKRTTKTESKWV